VNTFKELLLYFILLVIDRFNSLYKTHDSSKYVRYSHILIIKGI